MAVMNLSDKEDIIIKRGQLICYAMHIVDDRVLIGLGETMSEEEYYQLREFPAPGADGASTGGIKNAQEKSVEKAARVGSRGVGPRNLSTWTHDFDVGHKDVSGGQEGPRNLGHEDVSGGQKGPRNIDQVKIYGGRILRDWQNNRRGFAEKTLSEMFSKPKGCKTGIRGPEKTVDHQEVNKITRT